MASRFIAGLSVCVWGCATVKDSAVEREESDVAPRSFFRPGDGPTPTVSDIADASPSDVGSAPDASPSDVGSAPDVARARDVAPPPVCDDGELGEGPCGQNGRGIQESLCVAGQWRAGVCEDDDVCVDDAISEQACGNNDCGVEHSRCVQGDWVEADDCNCTAECVPGTTANQDCESPPGTEEPLLCREDGHYEVVGPCVAMP